MSAQPPGTESSDEQKSDVLVKRLVWDYVEGRMDRRASQTRTTVGVVIAMLGVIGIPSLYVAIRDQVTDTVSTSMEERLDTRLKDSLEKKSQAFELTVKSMHEQARRAQVEFDRSHDKLRTQSATMDALLSRLQDRKKDVDARLLELQRKSAGAEAALQSVEGLAAQVTSLSTEAERIQASIQQLAGLQEAARQSSAEAEEHVVEKAVPLAAADIDAIRVRQDVTTSGEDRSKRTLYLLTYTVFVDRTKTETDPKAILDAIETVTYRLDKRWFTPGEYVRDDSADGFRFSIRVWGVTSVDAEILVRGHAPVERSAYMSLQSLATF